MLLSPERILKVLQRCEEGYKAVRPINTIIIGLRDRRMLINR
jgi:hypothetical protein